MQSTLFRAIERSSSGLPWTKCASLSIPWAGISGTLCPEIIGKNISFKMSFAHISELVQSQKMTAALL